MNTIEFQNFRAPTYSPWSVEKLTFEEVGSDVGFATMMSPTFTWTPSSNPAVGTLRVTGTPRPDTRFREGGLADITVTLLDPNDTDTKTPRKDVKRVCYHPQ